MKTNRLTTMLAAASLAIAPAAANAAASLSVARAAAPTMSASFLQDEDSDHHGNTAVILGVLLVVLIGVAAISGNGHNGPTSP